MKEIVFALLGAIGGSLITLTLTCNHYSKKLYDRDVFQRINALVNLGSNNYNDEKKINEIVDDKTKNKPDTIFSKEEPKDLKDGGIWYEIIDK